jgi:hypothetical protein
MVDALRRACSLLYARGVIVDIHPTPEPAHLELATGSDFTHLADRLDDGTASGPRQRHAAADDAVAACVAAGMFDLAAATAFTFHTLADSVDELVGYLETKWKQPHFTDADLSRARDAHARSPNSAIAVTERLTACRLAGTFGAEADARN